MRRSAILLIAVIVTALPLSPGSASPPASGQAPQAGQETVLQRRLSAMARMVGARLNDRELESWSGRVRDSRDAGLSQFIQALLGTDGFLDQTAPGLLVGDYASFQNISPKLWALASEARDGRTIWFRGDKPACKASEAVSVRPWWSASNIFVCTDDYLPDVVRSHEGIQCSAMNLMKGCGCGPNLMRCAPADVATAVARSATDEVRDTVAYFIRNRRPIQELFVSNETYRNAYADFLYRRWQVEQGERKEVGYVGDDPAKAAWKPRAESAKGQHAGILTTQNVMFWESGLRPVMRVMYEMLWCSEPSSTGVSAAAVLDLGGADVRAGEGWEQLAQRPICTECHARLDYGMQFFRGYTDARKGIYFDPHRARTGEGNLYAKNIRDLRGHAELTPQGFARLAVQQPEFQACQVKKVVYRVFGAHADPDDFTAVREAMQKHGDLVSMVSAALYRYGSRALQPEASAVSAVRPSVGTTEETSVHLSPALRLEVEKRCGDCHSATEPILDSATLPIATIAKMAVNVAFGRMPKNGPIPDAERRSLVDQLLTALPLDRRASVGDLTRYYNDGYMSSRARSEGDIVADLRAGLGLPAHATPSRMWGRVPDDVYQLTPGLIATIAVDAIEACNEQKSMKPDVCLQHVLRFSQIRLAP